MARVKSLILVGEVDRDIIEEIDGHAGNTTTAHGAVSTATPSRIVIRDSSGRARFADPDNAADAATKGYVDGKDRARIAVLTAAGAYSPELDGAQKDNISGTYFDYPVCKFNKDTDEYIYYFFNLPPDYQAGNITVKLTWIAPTATSGAVVWNLAVRGVGAGEAWDAALGSTQAKTQTTEDVAGEKNVCTFDPFNPGWAAGDTVIVKISRDADNASDTLAEDAYLIAAVIEYTGR